jgi:hypothetical protein
MMDRGIVNERRGDCKSKLSLTPTVCNMPKNVRYYKIL